MLNNRFFFAGLLIAVMLVTVILTAIGGLAVSAAAGGSDQDTQPAHPAPIPRDSEKLRSDLNKAFNPEFAFNFEAVGNPFADKTNVSSAQIADQPNLPGQIPVNMLAGGRLIQPPAQFPRSSMPYAMMPNVLQSSPSPVAGSQLAPNIPTAPPAVDTKELVRERNRSIKLGRSVRDIASLFSIDEVRPYGTIGSGDTNYVKLYAKSTQDRLTVGRGTRFRDGVIEAISDEGVIFRRDDGKTVFSKWLRSTKAESDSAVLRVSPNQP